MKIPRWFREVSARLSALEDLVHGDLEERVTEIGRKVEGTRALEVPDDLDLRRLYACAVARWPELAAHEAGHIEAPVPDGVDLRRTPPDDIRPDHTHRQRRPIDPPDTPEEVRADVAGDVARIQARIDRYHGIPDG